MEQFEVKAADKLRSAQLRPTRQRLMLGSLLWHNGHRHVTAEQLHTEAKQAGMQVSMATVYNTLHQFVDAELLREVVIDGSCSYFDTNTEPHHHFLYEATGELEDIPADQIALPSIPMPTKAGNINSVDVIIRVGT